MSFDLIKIFRMAQAQGLVQEDDAQEAVLRAFMVIGEKLIKAESASFLSTLLTRSKLHIPGVYLWGPVGCGKTYLMDLFYKNVHLEKKGRFHFHEFMDSLHKQPRQARGSVNPIVIVAKKIASDYQLLCLDEFIVIDIADAMILGLLFEALFDLGVVLVITSNVEPDRLYWQGLQREQFLPAIEAIKKNMKVLQLDSSIDYRKRRDDLLRTRYLTPLDNEVSWMKARFDRLVGESDISVDPLSVQGRDLEIIASGDHVLWCRFHDLCATPRVASDYLLLIKCYKVICLSAIPALNNEHNDETRRFIHLIDACYDQKCLVIASGEKPIEEIYLGERLAQEFTRTISRLIEMQTWRL